MRPPFDLKPVELEARLVQYYLHTDGVGGAGPLTFIDATRSTLRDALNAPDDESARQALLLGCGAQATAAALVDGWSAAWPRDDCPGWFRFLVLTCAVVAEADENERSSAFENNLNALFGTTGMFGQRPALPRLWNRLVDWTQSQRARGRPIRRVVLPPPRHGVHIGLTNAVSFPNWRDSRRIRAWIDRAESNRKAALTPGGLARSMCLEFKALPNEPSNEQLKQAAAEFLELYDAQASLLRLHRLWGAVQRVIGRSTGPTARTGSVRAELQPGMSVADTQVVFLYTEDARAGEEVADCLRCGVDEVAARLASWHRAPRGPVAEVRSRFEQGAVAFVEERFGTWVASNAAIPSGSRALFLCRAVRTSRVHGMPLTPVSKITAGWSLIGPVEGPTATSVARALGLTVTQTAYGEGEAVKLDRGIRTRYGWLGRPSVLPWIFKPGPGAVELEPANRDDPTLRLGAFKDGWAPILSDEPIDGAIRLRLEETTRTGTALGIESTVQFVADAPEHQDTAEQGTGWTLLPDCRDVAWEQPTVFVTDRCGTVTACDPLAASHTDDLLEAVYARGRSGWGEADLVALIRDVVPGPSPWDVLQALREAGWLERTVSTRVKANHWWLVRCHLVSVGADGPVLLQGAASARIRRRFRETVRRLGGEVTETYGPSPYAPISCLATAVEVDSIALELGVTVRPLRLGKASPAPGCWPRSDRDPSKHSRHQTWSFDAGRFVGDARHAPHPVTLTRWVRDERDREDLFVVESNSGSRLVTPNRTVAIAEAYRRARRPMFEHRGDLLVRTTSEGHLPIHLARRAYLQTNAAAGPTEVDGRRTYVYPATPGLVDIVRRVLGHALVAGDRPSPNSVDPFMRYAKAAGEARHRDPGRHLAWGIRP